VGILPVELREDAGEIATVLPVELRCKRVMRAQRRGKQCGCRKYDAEKM
jgi:hypothetical protein